MGYLLGSWLLGQLWPDQVPVVRAKVAAGDSAVGDALDGDAVFWRDGTQAFNPLINGCGSHAKGP